MGRPGWGGRDGAAGMGRPGWGGRDGAAGMGRPGWGGRDGAAGMGRPGWGGRDGAAGMGRPGWGGRDGAAGMGRPGWGGRDGATDPAARTTSKKSNCSVSIFLVFSKHGEMGGSHLGLFPLPVIGRKWLRSTGFEWIHRKHRLG